MCVYFYNTGKSNKKWNDVTIEKISKVARVQINKLLKILYNIQKPV